MEAANLFTGGFFAHVGDGQLSQESRYMEQKQMENTNTNNNNHFAIDELLDFPKEDEVMADAFFDSITGNSADSSTVTVVDSYNSSGSGNDAPFNGSLSCRSFTDAQFSGGELCVPYDDLAELEWLSNFVEESFSTDDLQNLHLISATKAPGSATNGAADTSSSATTSRQNIGATINSPPPIFPSDVCVPGKARSKRSRAAPCDWSSRLLLLSPTTSSSDNISTGNSIPCDNPTAKAHKTTPAKKREATDTPGRKCLHCASEKTPQWRTGPMGPKTLCNACGVRYKSGRLVPEYRPAASPTFISTKHSNSHRKVLELRRQKDLQRHQVHQQQHLLSQTSIFGVANGGDDYLIHHHAGPDFRHMI